ncbi:MAG TPA: hypothetical protein VMD99_08085 [Terriglobales bacterium]|nr:hypothetical protein [Terriglobales bacterium]
MRQFLYSPSGEVRGAARKNDAVMRKITITLSLAVLVLAITAGWQTGSWELANMNFQEDIHDMASQAGAHTGVVAPASDEDLVRAVMRKAEEHGIELKPDQVTVRRTGSGQESTLYLAADYTVQVNLLLFSFHLHFAPSNQK